MFIFFFEIFCQFAQLFVMFDIVLRYQPPIQVGEVKPDYDHEGDILSSSSVPNAVVRGLFGRAVLPDSPAVLPDSLVKWFWVILC